MKYQFEFAQTLYKRLRRFKDIELWIDTFNIKPSDHIYETIEEGIEDCDIFIPVLTNKFRDSRNCMIELERAFRLSRSVNTVIMPILLSSCKEPIVTEGIKAVDFRGAVSDNNTINQTILNGSLQVLVKGIRDARQKISRIREIQESNVKAVQDLKWHIFYRVYYGTDNIQDIFKLYCDIIDDREFSIEPCSQFLKDINHWTEKGYIEGLGKKIDIQYRSFSLEKMYEKLQMTENGREFKRENNAQAGRFLFL